jgi:glycosyltransferase involved in cell wall biosynthesis
MKIISVVSPMFNEQEMASLFIKRVNDVLLSLNDYDYEIVLVNDGSNDETLEILKKEQEINNKIVIVNLTRNWGHESALFAGLKVAKGDAVIPMDADLQDPPEIIPDMIKLWEEGYDVVNARRKSRKEDTFFKRKSAGLFYKWANKISRGVKIPQNVANYRLISRRALDEVLALEETSRVFRIEVPFVGFKVGEVYFSRPKREKGKSKYKLSSMFSLAISSTVSLTNRPLEWSIHLTILIGLLFVISTFTQIGFLLVCLITNYLLISEFWNGIWLICNVMLLLTTIILFVLAVLSQYSGRSLDEVRKRPAVIIKEVMRK